MITLVLAFHNHQPVGNFDWVIEEAYQKAYHPLLTMLEEYPGIRFAQHYTGILLDWFRTHHPEFLGTIARGVERGQVELLSGGYYEPIMAMLPERDRQAQIGKLNRRIEEEFGVRPGGMWLAERVWEPSLPSTLHDAGIRYTILDDTHFKSAGLEEADLTGYFLTEDQGKPLAVLPIDKRLRYTMPFEAPEVTFEYLRSLDREGEDRVVVFADDGEKFGIWPETWHTVYEQGWLARFCELLVENASWLRTLPPGEVVATMKPAGRLYLPTASYAEMLHWALPSARAFLDYERFEHLLGDEKLLEEYGSFVRGGFWRNFLVKYPEANGMQKKMLRVSERVAHLRRELLAGGEEDATPLETAARRLDDAYNHLLAAQCNCPYWHGVFGGLYLSNIRSAMYREMIAAERDLDAIEGIREGRIEAMDYDFDGYEELLYENGIANIYLAPAWGGTIFEFDYKPSLHNFTDLLQRRREGYHERLASAGEKKEEVNGSSSSGAKSIHDIIRVKEKGLEKALVYDRYRHAMLVDHFYGATTDAAAIRSGEPDERGDFVGAPYETSWERRGTAMVIEMRRNGMVGTRPVRVEKVLTIEDSSADLLIDYTIRSLDGGPLHERFGMEMAYAMSAGTEPDRYYLIDGKKPAENNGQLNGAGESIGKNYALVDEWLGVAITVEMERPGVILRTPVETISLSEEGFERNYQGSVVVAVWDLEGAVEWRIRIEQRFTSTRS